MIDKQKDIFGRIKELKDRLEDFKCEMVLLRNACERLARERDAAQAQAEASMGVAKQLGANLEAAEKKAEAWMNRCQEVFGKLNDNFNEQFPQMLERAKEWAGKFAEQRDEAEAERDRLRAALEEIRDKRDVMPYDVARKALARLAEQPDDSDAVFVWPKNEVRQVKAKLGETRVRPPFVISDDDERPTAIFTEGHYFAITPGDEIQVEYVRKDSRLGFVWGEDSSWFVAMTNGYSASGYLDERLKMDELRDALKVFAEQPAAIPEREKETT